MTEKQMYLLAAAGLVAAWWLLSPSSAHASTSSGFGGGDGFTRVTADGTVTTGPSFWSGGLHGVLDRVEGAAPSPLTTIF